MALLLGAFPVSTVFAQSPNVQAARASALQTVEKAVPTTKDAAPLETVETKQSALLSILDLTTTEISDINGPDKLGTVVGEGDAGLAASAGTLRQRLSMYGTYVAIVRAQVAADGQSLESLKEEAVSFKAWRENVYDPAIHQAFDVLLVSQGNGVLLTAQHRLDKVSVDVQKLQAIRGMAASGLQALFDDAKKHIKSAADFENVARELLVANQRTFESLIYGDVVGGPRAVTLQRGSAGDFSCLPAAAGERCQFAFKRSAGGYYRLVNGNGAPIAYAISDISAVSGTLMTLSPSGSTDVVGVFFIDSFNVGARPQASTAQDTPVTASAFDTLISAVPASVSPTVQTLTKKILAEINAAYKDFFAMSALAKKLLAK